MFIFFYYVIKLQEISQVIFENIKYVDPNNKLIKNIKTDEGFKQESSYEGLQQSSNTILKKTSSTQNKTIFTNSENNIKSTSDDYIEENRSLDDAYIKEPINNNNDETEVDLKLIVNEEISPIYNPVKPVIKLSKQGIEPTNYDIVATVKNKSRINNKRV